MKKLLFIIPRVCCFIVVFSLCLVGNLLAQTYGCHVVVGVSDRIFYTPYGAGSPTEWQTVVTGTVTGSGEIGGYRADGSATYGCIKDIGGACTVYQQYLMPDGVTIGMRFYRAGTYAGIHPINCSLDDYALVLIVSSGFIVAFRIRKKLP
ncbi:MAG: hypothetical protein EOO42_06800 [Flavobacteriales bacterium]|nr:MAG: hypothetical protein EOO42_06800 [Flavobacteriales bacterium]